MSRLSSTWASIWANAAFDSARRSSSKRPTLLRAQRRRATRGNALFVALMVITLLTAIGMYSMRAASLADQATGFNRMGVQTTYVAEFAGRSVAAELVGKEQHYFQYISSGNDDCRNNKDLAALVAPNRPPCYKLETGEIWERVDGEFPGNAGSVQSPNLLGQLSRSDLQGAFIVEMTDLGRTGSPIAGEDVAADTFKHMSMLLTATGQVRPTDAGDEEAACSAAFATTSGLSTLRAQITFGPVN